MVIDMNFINKDFKLTSYKDPYPYIVIENFFEKEFFKNIEKKFPSENDFKSQKNKINRMNYDTSIKDKLYEQLLKKESEYKELHNYIYSDNFINYFIKLFQDSIASEIKNENLKDILKYKIKSDPFETEKILSKLDIKENSPDEILYPRLDLGMGTLGYGKNTGGKGIHVDNPQRLISILLYFGGYKHIKGGELRIWKKVNDTLEISNIIKPTPNSLVASLQSNISFHDVNPVTEIDGTRNACYIAISSNNKIWKNLEYNQFNKKFHKNRVKKNNSIFEKVINFFK
tara:strand:+ start:576 stop:1433 length:858 start_codon:yes stop_codon:yes gene_type:complete